MEELIDRKLKHPGNDLLSKLANEQLEPGNIDKQVIRQIVFLILVAGYATQINTIGLGVVTALDHPDQLAAPRKDPSLALKFINEFCRVHTASALSSRRVASVDIAFEGNMIKKIDGGMASNQAGEQRRQGISEPKQIRYVSRFKQPMLAFGHGRHACIREWLSSTELETTFAKWFTKLPNLKVAGELKYTPPTKDVGLSRVDVQW